MTGFALAFALIKRLWHRQGRVFTVAIEFTDALTTFLSRQSSN
jgi:hypothetical protein